MDHWLSCILDCIHICVFLLSKNCFWKAGSTPPRFYLSSFLSCFLSQSRQHLDTWWIDRESFWPLDNSSTPGGSIEHHVLLLVFFFLNSFLTHDLSTLLFLDTCSTNVSTPPWHLICRELLMVYKFSSCNPQLTSVNLSLDTSDFSFPKPLSLTPNLFPWDSQAFFKFSFTW